MKNNFRVIQGGADLPINEREKRFVSAFVTDTRLMGVIVLYIHWEVDTPDGPVGFHQFFYIETTETGIESYRSIFGDDSNIMMDVEQAMLGGLGGKKVDISRKEVYSLIQIYAKMTKRFGKELPGGLDEYQFILDDEVEMNSVERANLFKKICVPIRSNGQLINYFLMRYFGRDFPAIDYLSITDIDKDLAPNKKPETLYINKITSQKHDGTNSYICESLIENGDTYEIVLSEIQVEGRLVSAFNVLSSFPISSTEAAMKLERPEFITIYEILGDKREIQSILEKKYLGGLKKVTDHGKMFLNFKTNNDHLGESLYRLNDDIRDLIYITNEQQLIVAAYSLNSIENIEKEMQTSEFGSLIVTMARYEFKEPIFYDFMQSNTGNFLQYMDYINDFDPNNDD